MRTLGPSHRGLGEMECPLDGSDPGGEDRGGPDAQEEDITLLAGAFSRLFDLEVQLQDLEVSFGEEDPERAGSASDQRKEQDSAVFAKRLDATDVDGDREVFEALVLEASETFLHEDPREHNNVVGDKPTQRVEEKRE